MGRSLAINRPSEKLPSSTEGETFVISSGPIQANRIFTAEYLPSRTSYLAAKVNKSSKVAEIPFTIGVGDDDLHLNTWSIKLDSTTFEEHRFENLPKSEIVILGDDLISKIVAGKLKIDKIFNGYIDGYRRGEKFVIVEGKPESAGKSSNVAEFRKPVLLRKFLYQDHHYGLECDIDGGQDGRARIFLKLTKELEGHPIIEFTYRSLVHPELLLNDDPLKPLPVSYKYNTGISANGLEMDQELVREILYAHRAIIVSMPEHITPRLTDQMKNPLAY